MAEYNYNFGKLDENGNIEFAPLPLPVNGNTWTNDPEIYFSCGFFPIQNTEPPVKEGFYYTSFYVLENDVIVQKWEEHEEPEEPVIDDELTEYAEAAKILLGESE